MNSAAPPGLRSAGVGSRWQRMQLSAPSSWSAGLGVPGWPRVRPPSPGRTEAASRKPATASGRADMASLPEERLQAAELVEERLRHKPAGAVGPFGEPQRLPQAEDGVAAGGRAVGRAQVAEGVVERGDGEVPLRRALPVGDRLRLVRVVG